jgi:hypothetical protein
MIYDRDYVKSLEREIEINSGNRFEGWDPSAAFEERIEASDSKTICAKSKGEQR